MRFGFIGAGNMASASSLTTSPTCTDHDKMVPSVILSPNLGIFISNLAIYTIIYSFTCTSRTRL